MGLSHFDWFHIFWQVHQYPLENKKCRLAHDLCEEYALLDLSVDRSLF